MRALREDLDLVDRFAEAMRARVYVRHGNPSGLAMRGLAIEAGTLVDSALMLAVLHCGFEAAELAPGALQSGAPSALPLGMRTVPVPHLGLVT